MGSTIPDNGSLAIINQSTPIISVCHENLLPKAASYYESICPFCEKGHFKAKRNETTHLLEQEDQCLVCGQRICYLDIETVRKKDPFRL